MKDLLLMIFYVKKGVDIVVGGGWMFFVERPDVDRFVYVVQIQGAEFCFTNKQVDRARVS